MPINYDQSGVVYDSTVYTWDGEVRTSTVFPIVGVFVAFNDGPYTANPGWQEITPYVRAVSTHRGRSNDLEQFDTGTAQLVLDNRDRRFDPFYTSGPYYTKLTPRRQIRIVGQIGGSNYDVFRGYIAGWPVTWSDAGKDSTVTIQAFDALGLMANETVPTDWPYYYTSSLTPLHYWRCNDSRGGQTIKDWGSNPLTLSRSSASYPYFFDQPALAAGLTGTSAVLVSYTAPSTSVASTVGDFAFSGWIQFSGAVGTDSLINIYNGNVLLSLDFVQVAGARAANSCYIQMTSTSWGYEYSLGISLTNAIPHFWAINFDSATQTLQIWVDGQDVTGTRTAIANRYSGANDSAGFLGITGQELCIYQYKLSTAQVAALQNFGSGIITETTTARMNRLISTTDYPTLLTAFTASPAATVAEIGTGANVIPEMQLVADSEGGELYVNKSGILTTTNRTDVFTATRSAVSQATITDSGAGLKYGTELNIQYDADNLKNDVTVNYSGGGQVEVYNDATIAGYGAASTVIETQLADPTSANQLALMELGVEGSLIPQISPIDLSPNTAAADWQTILGLELLDRVTFKRTPTVGNQFNRDALINAIDHQIAPGVWNTQVTLSMRYTSPLTLDDDILGTLDLNYLG